jgi:hypothetical protein
MRVICRMLDHDIRFPQLLQDRINDLILAAEAGKAACRVVGVGVAYCRREARPPHDDVDVFLVTLATTDGPEERSR